MKPPLATRFMADHGFARVARSILALLVFAGPALASCDWGAPSGGGSSAGSTLFGIPRNQALVLQSGESNNPRSYDPATSGGDDMIFSGLVSFNPQMQVTPDLAQSWDISPDGTVYTFRLRPSARFHSGRAVSTQDVIYSWERAADPATNSNMVLTYMGDISGLREMREGKAKHISGLKAIDEHTLQVTIDAPKPYFLMKLTYGVADLVDKANVESGTDWYRTPNGTGPYKLTRWESSKVQIYERYADYYLPPPAVKYIIVRLYAGSGIRLYETGDIDLTGISSYDVDRLRSPSEPLHSDLVEGVGMCTSYVAFDVKQAPFDDPKVRRAFAVAVDKQAYVDRAVHGAAIPAHGLYPPALAGYNQNLKGLDYDPALARKLLSESRYGSADKLPPVVFTTNGFGSSVSPGVAALADMWKQNLGVQIVIQNVEPDRAADEMQAGRHGQLYISNWCADYPDPENVADVLFHSGTENNFGHYSNATLDVLLEKARVERDVKTRTGMYGQAEELIVADAPAIFLAHRFSFILVKPYVKGYTLSPISIPVWRYLSLDASRMP
jgi:oligopeptide transport system substrate-binding protein